MKYRISRHGDRGFSRFDYLESPVPGSARPGIDYLRVCGDLRGIFAPLAKPFRIPSRPSLSARGKNCGSTMDLSSKDYSLNFRGFEHDDPETVQRFTAFCQANFALPPETVRLLQHAPETVVLTHGGSIEELEALARVLREIGAVVDVSSDSPADIPSLVGGPTTQELHRLFGGDSAIENDDEPAFCPYPPPLGRSLYLLSSSGSVVDRKALRQRALQNSPEPLASTTEPPAKSRSLVTISCIAIVVGMVALAVAATLVKRDSLSLRSSTDRNFQEYSRTDAPRKEQPRVESGPARTLSASATVEGFDVELKVLASTTAVSISSLMFNPTDSANQATRSGVRRIIGEPVFLTETSPGTWVGSIILSVSVEENGTTAHVSTPASITVRFNAHQSEGRVSIETDRSSHSESPLKVTKLNND